MNKPIMLYSSRWNPLDELVAYVAIKREIEPPIVFRVWYDRERISPLPRDFEIRPAYWVREYFDLKHDSSL